MDLVRNFFGLPSLSDDDAERCRRHVKRTVDGLGVQWREEAVGFLEAEGDLGQDWFVSPTIVNEFDYLVGLHEAGHHELKVPTYEDDGETVIFDNELAVWQWVHRNALIDPSAEAWNSCVKCLDEHSGQRAPREHVEAMRASCPYHAEMRWR